MLSTPSSTFGIDTGVQNIFICFLLIFRPLGSTPHRRPITTGTRFISVIVFTSTAVISGSLGCTLPRRPITTGTRFISVIVFITVYYMSKDIQNSHCMSCQRSTSKALELGGGARCWGPILLELPPPHFPAYKIDADVEVLQAQVTV